MSLRFNQTNRREFLQVAAWGGVGASLYGLGGGALRGQVAAVDPAGAAVPGAATKLPLESLSWLGGKPPLVPVGVSWGVPWARGTVAKDAVFAVKAADGRLLPTQNWPLAFWPDGSLKWSGLSIAGSPDLGGPLTVSTETPPAPGAPIQVKDSGGTIEVSTGPLVCRIPRHGDALIESLVLDGREVGRHGRLVVSREDRSAEAKGTVRVENFTGHLTSATVEQAGPVRAVVRLEGRHVGSDGDRAWLPFFVRLYFTAGVQAVRLVHSFVFDGDAQTDFIKGLGVSFTVPFREEKQNRHVRFASDGDGVWGEPVLMSPGYRAVLVKNADGMMRQQLLGERIPNLADLGEKEKAQFETVAVWDAFKLSQAGPDSFSFGKRTNEASSWLHVFSGNRASGLAFLGDVTGGLAVGMKGFWQKYPTALEMTGAATDAGELKLWFWSPDAPAMDLRHYDTVGHDGKISYEDHQEGFSTPTGVANTNELMIWALGTTPAHEELAAMAKTTNEPPLLVCQPDYYHATQTLGIWSLPDRSTPDLATMEDQLDRAWTFYAGEVDRRRWYGFWDFGDVMRTYDTMRHCWMYDIGGHAWDNTELMPNAWLWFTFLRKGTAETFRLAEAMTRNTGEVDVYHLGRFFGLGSRHNVSHWGCGAKEARISEAWLKRPYYYLTTDERTGDLMREVLTVDETIARIQPLRHELVRADVPAIFRIGPDWIAMASNWMTEWERTGNTQYRDYVLTGMKCLGAVPEAFTTEMAFRYDLKTKELFDMGQPNLKAGEFLDLFGGDQIISELIDLIPCPTFAEAWHQLCDKWGKDPKWKGYTKMRIAAYAANQDRDVKLKDEAWQLLLNCVKGEDNNHFVSDTRVIEGPLVPERVVETSNGKLDTPGTAQWALNLLTTTELARRFQP